ncbi:hypothetical protein K438DRAFT_1841257 [Mycena galopus ATCC 62051]|nr:hypothetical protein K438DRAFT_1841257 [Mycena galopus ATCC 62051]
MRHHTKSSSSAIYTLDARSAPGAPSFFNTFMFGVTHLSAPSMDPGQLWMITPHLPLIALLAGLLLLGLRAFLVLRRTPFSGASEEYKAELEPKENPRGTNAFWAQLPLPVSYETLPPLVPLHREPQIMSASPTRRHTMPTPYASRTPASMAQIIMVRHMSSRRSPTMPSPPKRVPASFSSVSRPVLMLPAADV